MSGEPQKKPWTFELLGGRLCLDFANTVSGLRGTDARDRLGSYEVLLSWARQVGVLDAAGERRLLAEARRRPEDAAATFREAIALREAVHDLFLAFARGEAPPAGPLAAVNAWLGRALAHRRVTPGEGCCALGWEELPGALDAPLWPVAASAAELLVSGGDLARVRVCGLFEDGECGWLFLDETRSHTRRWCSMKDCGNRAKARRHYQRVKAGG